MSIDTEGWYIDPEGNEHCGNVSEKVPDAVRPFFEKLAASTSSSAGQPVKGSLIERLEAGEDACNVITPDEVKQVFELYEQGLDKWEPIKDFGKVQVLRWRDTSLFEGCLFGYLKAHYPEATKEEVAQSLLNLEERAVWDHQVAGFSVWPGPAGNDLLHCKFHASPLWDRDFVVFQTLVRHREGRGVLTYMRYADNSFAPSQGTEVRGRISIIGTLITDHPAGGAMQSTITVLDPKIPVIPQWIVNAFIPSQFQHWAGNLEANCKKLRQRRNQGAVFPCDKLFLPQETLPPMWLVPFGSSSTATPAESLRSQQGVVTSPPSSPEAKSEKEEAVTELTNTVKITVKIEVSMEGSQELAISPRATLGACWPFCTSNNWY